MPPDADISAALDPDEIAGQRFNRARKGYEVDEVRAFLVGLGSKVRDTQRRFADMERRLEELERRAVDPKDLDGAAVTALLGEETARVLESARQAASETRAKADDAAAATTAEADAAAEAVRTDADTYAAETRSTADTEVAELRTEAEIDAAEMRSAAETVLVERTEAAEVEASRITTEVEAYRVQVRGDADTYAAEIRSGADTYAVDRQSEADDYNATATAEAEQLGVDAAADVEALRSAADAELAGRRQEADAEVEELLADTKEQGRIMVQEARTYRERVIGDLAERRRSLRTHLEDMAATRDALAVTLTDVTSDIDAAHRSLQAVVVEPRAEADPAIDRRVLDPEEPSRDPVGVGELDVEEPVEGGTGESDAADDLTDPVEGAEPTFVEEDTDALTDVDDPAVGDEVEEVPVEEVADEEVSADADGAADDDADGAAADADDIFARLRSQQDPDEAPTTGDPQAGEGPAPADADAPVEGDRDAPGEDADLLDRRDATTDEVERQLARRLKRVLSDEQNEALDLLRRAKGEPSEQDVIPAEADHLARYVSAAREDLLTAERAGAGFFGDAPDHQADVDDIATEFATEMVRQIRSRLARAFADGGDEQEVGERLRACYREWKTQRIADTARHYVGVAFSRGVAEAAGDGDRFRWLVDDGDAPCPDCDDNALAGPTAKGDPFPTGDLCPPAHPGCRCLAVPVS